MRAISARCGGRLSHTAHSTGASRRHLRDAYRPPWLSAPTADAQQ